MTGYDPGATVAMPSTAHVRAPGSVTAAEVETTASDMPAGSPVATAVRAEPADATSVAETVTWEASLYCTGGASLVTTGRWIANVRATEARLADAVARLRGRDRARPEARDVHGRARDRALAGGGERHRQARVGRRAHGEVRRSPAPCPASGAKSIVCSARVHGPASS